MKLIMAVSADGYVAKGPTDDMSWTGRADKHAFRLLTSVGGVCAAGSRTFDQMPKLPGRELIRLTRHAPPNFDDSSSMTLGRFAYLHPSGWLLGGPTVAQEAFELGMVDEAFFSVAEGVKLDGGIGEALRARMASRFWQSRTVLTLDVAGSRARVERWARG